MKLNVSSRFSEWVLSNMLKEYSEPASKNSTHVVNYLGDVITEIKDKTTVQAIKETAVQIIPTSVPEWNKAEQDIKASLDWQSLQIGEPTEAEFIIEDLISQTSVIDTMVWVYDLFLNNADNALMACTLIHALSHLEYELIYPQGPMMAMAMFGSTDKRVVGFAVKAFSNWNSKDSVKYIEHFKPRWKWAERELDRIINYIRENGDDLNGVPDEKNHTTKVDTRTA